MTEQETLIPIYSTRGEVAAFLSYPYIFDRLGEWIGWVTPDRLVYSVHGHYVGWLSKDPRILRKLAGDASIPRTPPLPPKRIRVPSMVPLAPMMSELTYGVVDVLDDALEFMPTLDFGERREDME
jgi:hypothetical protein